MSLGARRFNPRPTTQEPVTVLLAELTWDGWDYEPDMCMAYLCDRCDGFACGCACTCPEREWEEEIAWEQHREMFAADVPDGCYRTFLAMQAANDDAGA